jgi:hypothetical protein
MIQAAKANRAKRFLSFPNIEATSGTHPIHIQCILGDLSEEVKQKGREAHHAPPSSAVVKKEWSYNSTSPVRLIIVQEHLDLFLYL